MTDHVWRLASDQTLFNVADTSLAVDIANIVLQDHTGGHLTVCVALVISILVSGGSVAFVGVVVPAVVPGGPALL